ncbi:hypothetical protein GW17_00033467 [Ensete ventricosum]|nr:hypothetical protein GW17_00033467 [Ensete ventricosum]
MCDRCRSCLAGRKEARCSRIRESRPSVGAAAATTRRREGEAARTLEEACRTGGWPRFDRSSVVLKTMRLYRKRLVFFRLFFTSVDNFSPGIASEDIMLRNCNPE